MRFVGLPTTFNRSIGFSVAGVSNFIGSAFRLHQHPGERSLHQRQLVGILMARPGAREKGGRRCLRAARQLGVGLLASPRLVADARSEEHTSELQSLMRLSYAVFCFKT